MRRVIMFCVCSDSFPPFKIAALPDLMAKEVILTITSGRASKMTSSTPIGPVRKVNCSQ